GGLAFRPGPGRPALVPAGVHAGPVGDDRGRSRGAGGVGVHAPPDSRSLTMAGSPSRPLGRGPWPICLPWAPSREAPRVQRGPAPGAHQPFRARGQNETREAFEQRRLRAQRLCILMRDGTSSTHYLPDKYGDFGDPVVIGLVGHRAAGKTLLLAAMV